MRNNANLLFFYGKRNSAEIDHLWYFWDGHICELVK